MNTRVLRVAWYRFATTFRRRRTNLLIIVLLIGLVGGLGLGSLAGARRTQSAFSRALAATHASELQFQPSPGNEASLALLYNARFTNRLAHLRDVTHVAASVQMFIAPLHTNGHAYLPAPLKNNVVETIGPINGEYYSQDRVIADQGRVPNPTKMDEFAVTAQTARLMHWHVGQVISMGAFTLHQVLSSSLGLPRKPTLDFDARLVGIIAFAGSVVHDEVDTYPAFALFTPALANRLLPRGGDFYANYALRLKGGKHDVAAVERKIINILPPGSTYSFHETSVVQAQVNLATKPQSLALGVFGVIAALAALVIAGLAIGRELSASGADLDVLRALGADTKVTTTDSLLGTFGAVVVGSLLTVVVAILLSPIAPIGAVRAVDPSPGFAADWTVLVIGFGVFVVVLGGVAVILGAANARRRQRVSRAPQVVRGSSAVRTATRLALPVSAVQGIRFALERGRGRSAAPVGSALVGAVLAIVVVVTTLTFGSGLATLVSRPNLYGWNWSYAIDEVGGGRVPLFTRQLLDHDQYVAAWSGYSYADIQIDGQTVPTLISSVDPAVSPPILSGRGLRSDGQIVLGAATLKQLGKHVGQTVVAGYGSKADVPIYVPPTTLTIVGAATLPAIGNPSTLHVSMGTGAVVPNIEPPAMVKATSPPNSALNGPTIVVVRLRDGVAATLGLASLRSIAAKSSRYLDATKDSGGGTFAVLAVQRPAEIVNYEQSGDTPAILAGALAVGAIVALGLTLISSVNRRRRDLALLKSLGFTKRQLAYCVTWQSTVAVVVGLIIGMPTGILLGRWLWDLFARDVYVVPVATVPTLSLVYVGLGALLLANAVAAFPGRYAARTPIALLLRGE